MAATLPPVTLGTGQSVTYADCPGVYPEKVVVPKKVIAIGDSLVYGYGDSEGGGWVERLRRGYLDPQQPGPIFYNLGVRGDGVAQVAKRLGREFRDRGELRRRTPDFLVLSVGVNDSARACRPDGRPVTDRESFAKTLEQLLIQSQRLCPVFFVGMVPVNELAMPFANVLYFSRKEQRYYNQVTRQLCEAHQVPYLDLFEQWSRESDEWVCDRLCPDGIHPNSRGYCTILETVSAWQPFTQVIKPHN
ncbi:MAG: GDSL-type esterase/lipase family protein [Cyanobacteria bacterium P01_D01_bin.1]